MENLEQILEALRSRVRRAWPLRIDPPHKMQQGVLYPDTPEKQYMPILQNFNWAAAESAWFAAESAAGSADRSEYYLWAKNVLLDLLRCGV